MIIPYKGINRIFTTLYGIWYDHRVTARQVFVTEVKYLCPIPPDEKSEDSDPYRLC